MDEKILVPDFSNREPTVASTRAKNERGLCCFHECQNKLPETDIVWFMGFKMCKECADRHENFVRKMEEEDYKRFQAEVDKFIKKIQYDEGRRNWQAEEDKEIIDEIIKRVS